jgi:hypothetical protein
VTQTKQPPANPARFKFGEFSDFTHRPGPGRCSTFDLGHVGDHTLTVHTPPEHTDNLTYAMQQMDADARQHDDNQAEG